ncbi:uncharacterized protein LOC128627636 isoform X2 [Artibeus jamaicensis]|uniref:uncharacterized protein LOC128627636 isoform X2 n=1 Tax=Artibeus jamaicensis TaxID=9417 RepID=UPI00235AC768|nr:uncharacterized protein LOC128627636 isoform X2 [Artibeus jamaicensis]
MHSPSETPGETSPAHTWPPNWEGRNSASDTRYECGGWTAAASSTWCCGEEAALKCSDTFQQVFLTLGRVWKPGPQSSQPTLSSFRRLTAPRQPTLRTVNCYLNASSDRKFTASRDCCKQHSLHPTVEPKSGSFHKAKIHLGASTISSRPGATGQDHPSCRPAGSGACGPCPVVPNGEETEAQRGQMPVWEHTAKQP